MRVFAVALAVFLLIDLMVVESRHIKGIIDLL